MAAPRIENWPPLVGRLAASWPPDAWADLTVLVTVSGGADSVALLRALVELRAPGAGRLLVAHFNHRLRGAESDADQQFVEQLAAQLGLTCLVDAAPVADGPRDEDRARRLRYQAWEALAARHGARLVVTAHTADDQAETVLHRVLRGTGIAGLAGIPRARPLGVATLLRPLLHESRAEIVTYLEALGQPYRTDHTNAESGYTRNRLRNELLPQLAETYNRDIRGALTRLGTLAGEAQQVIAELAARLHERVRPVTSDGAIRFDAAALAEEPAYLVREFLVALWREADYPAGEMTLAHWQQLAALVQGSEPRAALSLPGAVTVRRARTAVTLTR